MKTAFTVHIPKDSPVGVAAAKVAEQYGVPADVWLTAFANAVIERSIREEKIQKAQVHKI